jgi:two-component system, NtrC family, sensor kinase
MKHRIESHEKLAGIRSLDAGGLESERSASGRRRAERGARSNTEGPSLVTSATSFERSSTSAVAVPDEALDARMRALAHMAGQIAHRFNNHLTVLGLNASHLHDRHDGESREQLEEMLQTCDRGSELISKLLHVSGGYWSEPQEVDLGRLLRSMDLRWLLSDRVGLCIDTTSEPCRVRIDPVRMEEVVRQLVQNADAAMEGRGTIRIGLDILPGRPEGPGPRGERVQLEVADTGPGMTEPVLSRVFEPFFTTRGSADGVAEGLGLSMVYGILRRAGGTVSIESALGRGTAVRVQLPRA